MRSALDDIANSSPFVLVFLSVCAREAMTLAIFTMLSAHRQFKHVLPGGEIVVDTLRLLVQFMVAVIA